MRLPGSRRARAGAGGFTLAEVAVTLLIVGLVLVLMLEGLNLAKLTAAHTRNSRLARELGLLTLGQIEAGLFWDDIDSGRGGTYAEEGYPDFFYEIALGDDTFLEADPDRPFDNWAYAQELQRDRYDEEDRAEEIEQPYEKVRVKVTFPPLREFSSDVILERWIPWAQVYGEDEDAVDTSDQAAEDSGDDL